MYQQQAADRQTQEQEWLELAFSALDGYVHLSGMPPILMQ